MVQTREDVSWVIQIEIDCFGSFVNYVIVHECKKIRTGFTLE